MKVRYVLYILALLTIGVNSFIPYGSSFIEDYYSNGIFLWVRRIHDYTLGRLPFPQVYLLFIVMIISFLVYFKRYKERRDRYPFVLKGISILFSDLLTFFSIVIILFYWLWAFNYKRVPFEKKNNLQKTEITEEWLFDELKTIHDSLVTLYNYRSLVYDHKKIEYQIRTSLSDILPKLGYDVSGKARVRQLNPKGLLLVWSTAGVYLPFVSEGHIDNGLPSLTKPFTLAHEMSHGYGIASESTCNFTALMACINSSDPNIRYSGWLGYFRYILSAARRTNSDRYKEFYENEFNQNVIDDLNLIYEQLQKYPDILPKLRYFIYDSYLKSHGVKEGMISYSRVVHLASAWSEKYGKYNLYSD